MTQKFSRRLKEMVKEIMRVWRNMTVSLLQFNKSNVKFMVLLVTSQLSSIKISFTAQTQFSIHLECTVGSQCISQSRSRFSLSRDKKLGSTSGGITHIQKSGMNGLSAFSIQRHKDKSLQHTFIT
jgi:hypothetical protein